MLNLVRNVKEKAASLFEREEENRKTRRIEELERALTAEEQRAQDLARLDALAKVASVQAFQKSLAPEAAAIAKAMVSILPHLQSAEQKWREATRLAFEAANIAEDHQVANPCARDLVLSHGQAEICRVIGHALAEAGADRELVLHLDDWVAPRVADVAEGDD